MISSHLIEDLERIADYVLFIKDGRLVLHGYRSSFREQYGKSMADMYRDIWRGHPVRSTGKAISVLLVIGILILYSVITRALPKLSNDSTVLVVREFIASIPTLIFSVVVTVGCTLGTGYLVNRKISL
ncbi:MAG: hypothetical protein K5897_02560 [Eubacterium sp.]|nr:hypothetical protein [Eubacterium sp.]